MKLIMLDRRIQRFLNTKVKRLMDCLWVLGKIQGSKVIYFQILCLVIHKRTYKRSSL